MPLQADSGDAVQLRSAIEQSAQQLGGVEVGTLGITANNVQPGPTRTEIITEDKLEFLRAMMPIGRLGEDHEVAALAAWLCRVEAAFVNGASLTTDGGYSA